MTDAELRKAVLGAFQHEAEEMFFYYGRKDGDSLSVDALNDAIARGVVTRQDILDLTNEILDRNGFPIVAQP